VGSQQIWDEVSHIPEQEGASQLVAPRATVPRATPRPAPAPTPAPTRRTTNVRNWKGDPGLGKAWEDLKTQCGPVKQAAKRGEHGVTPLPKSSVAGHQNDPMCLNWSVLHECTAECGEAYDHVDQPATKKEELKQWVETQAKKVPPRQRRSRRRGGGQSANE